MERKGRRYTLPPLAKIPAGAYVQCTVQHNYFSSRSLDSFFLFQDVLPVVLSAGS